MADDTPVNSQITDAVTPSSSTVLDFAGATTVSEVQQLALRELALLMENATKAQQSGRAIADAAVARGVELIYGTDKTSGEAVS